MKKTVHILTRKDDDLARLFIKPNVAWAALDGKTNPSEDRSIPSVSVIDLSLPNPDYDGLVRAIFDADHVAVW